MPESTPKKAAVIVKLHEQDESLERILEAAVVVSWVELMRGRSGLIHIEYGFAPNATLDHLQVWSSIKRGYWLLACTYWMSASQSHDAGVHFDNGYESEDLAHILEVVMQHQNLFSLPHNLGRDGLLQIGTPTEKESKAAAASINDAVGRVNSLAEPTAKTVAQGANRENHGAVYLFPGPRNH
jgi:hypothetical protein